MKKRLVIFLWTWPAVAFVIGLILINQGIVNPAFASYMVVLWMTFTAQSWVVNQLLDN